MSDVVARSPELASRSVEDQRDDDDLLSGPAWGRHPVDVVRAVVAGVAFVVLLYLCLRHAGDVRSVSVDLVELVNRLPRWVRDLLLGISQIVALVVPMGMALILVRRPRLLATALGAAVAAGLVMALVQGWIDDAVPNRVREVTERVSWLTGAAFPSGAYVAGFTAAVVVLGPVISRFWRRAALVGLSVGILSRVVTAVAVPLNLAVTVALGALVGSLALLVVGSPRRRASRRTVLAGLASSGFPAVRIDPIDVGARHSRTFTATAADGRRAFVKLLGRDERDADLILRAMKRLRVKDLDDDRPSWTPRRIVEHEAYTALLAARAGVSTPGVLAAGETAGADGIVAFVPVPGTRLDEMPLEEVTDDLLDEVWAQLSALHGQGIAHRWFTTSNLLVDVHASGPVGAPKVTLVDNRWAAHQADPGQMASDIAMLAASLALIVGAERAVAAAARALTPEQLEAALPLVQPLALPPDLRDAIGGQEHVLPAVRGRLQAAAGGVPYELADIQRIKPARLVTLFGLVFVAYSALLFASSWSETWEALRSVSPAAIPVLVFLATVPYFAGASVLRSVVPVPPSRSSTASRLPTRAAWPSACGTSSSVASRSHPVRRASASRAWSAASARCWWWRRSPPGLGRPPGASTSASPGRARWPSSWRWWPCWPAWSG